MRFVITLLGQDRPGIVESFSKAVADHEGTWCESRVLQVDGQFGGVFHAVVSPETSDAFESTLKATFESEFQLGLARSTANELPEPSSNKFSVRVLCGDRPGLLHEFAQLCSARAINILELQTNLVPAPMTGLMMFEIEAVGELLTALDRKKFANAIEALGNDVSVDFF